MYPASLIVSCLSSAVWHTGVSTLNTTTGPTSGCGSGHDTLIVGLTKDQNSAIEVRLLLAVNSFRIIVKSKILSRTSVSQGPFLDTV